MTDPSVVADLDKAWRSDPESSFANLIALGSEHLRAGNLEEARIALERAESLRPGIGQVQNLLGLTYFKLGNLQFAQKIFETLVDRFPGESAVSLNLALVLFKGGHLQSAHDRLLQIVEQDPSHKRAAGYLGLVCEQLGNLPGAVRAYELAESYKLAESVLRRHAEEMTGSKASAEVADFLIRSGQDSAATQVETPGETAAEPEQAVEAQGKSEESEANVEVEVAPDGVEPVEVEPVEAEQVEAEQVEPAEAEVEPVEVEPVEPAEAEVEPVEVEPVEPVEVAEEPVEVEPVEPVEVAEEPVEVEPVETEAEESGTEAEVESEPEAVVESVPEAEVEVEDEVEPQAQLDSDEAEVPNPIAAEEAATGGVEGSTKSHPKEVDLSASAATAPRPVTLPGTDKDPTASEATPMVLSQPPADAGDEVLDLGEVAPIQTPTRVTLLDGMALVRLEDHALLRSDRWVGRFGDMTSKPAFRRNRGQETDQELGGTRPLISVEGSGTVLLRIDEAIAVTASMEGDLFVVEPRLLALLGQCRHETGQVNMPDGSTLTMLRLRGQGHVVLVADRKPARLRIALGTPTVVLASSLLAFVGKVLPRIAPAGPRSANSPPMLHLLGEGEAWVDGGSILPFEVL